MTREEAIKVLEKQFDKSCGNYRYQNAEKLDFEDALWMAISALQQQGQERNAPLTLDELREMPCEPVYIVAGYVSWWDIVSYAGMEYLYLKVEGSLPFRDYGKNWTAYRQKPKEGTV